MKLTSEERIKVVCALIAGGYVTYQEPFTAKGLADMVRAVEEELKCL